MVIMVSDIESVELTIDTSTVMATLDYVDDKLAEHEQSRRHPDATLTEKGFTQLSNATDSTSETLAATPKAVKTAYDLANGKYTAQDATTAQKGIVQLSSATDSASESVAATPKAVKTAYDLANGKYTAKDATTAQKGIVQLSSATDSTSETLAATPKAVKAANDNANGRVPASGGSVAYLENATYYKTNPAGWYGGGAFADQYRNNAAPFLVPYGFVSTKDVSVYLPIVKGISHTAVHGYAASVSFGILRSGKADFGSAVINIVGDNGNAAVYSYDVNGTFNAPGQVYSGGTIVAAGQISSGGNIVAGQGLYESGGAVRVYSSNNPPTQYAVRDWITSVGLVSNNPSDPYVRQESSGAVIYLATRDWVNSYFGMVNGFRRGGQQLQNPTDAWFGNWESPAGCTVTGITMEGRSDGRKLGVYYRQMQYFNKQANSWINVGD
jgi:hypothetical protein